MRHSVEAANRVFAEYSMKLRTAGNIPDAISTSVVVADIRLALGNLHEAISTLEQLLKFVLDQGEPISLEATDLHRELGNLYLEQGNLESAAQHLQRSKELGEKAQLPVSRYRLCIDLARLKTAQGNLEEALAFLEAAQRLYIRSPLPDFCPISAIKARIWVAQGKLTKALEWVREGGLSVDEAPSYLREFEHVTLARVLIAQYQNDCLEGPFYAALRLLDSLLQAAEEGGRMGSVIEILVLQALTHQTHGDIRSAFIPLERALTLAEPEGFVRVFVDEGEAMRMLITEFRFSIEKQTPSSANAQPSYTEKLLVCFASPVNKQSIMKDPKPEIVEPLSERELDVLRLLRTDLNGPDIARELTVSLSTLRTHTQHIYAKLGVNNRRAAVRRAEELNLS